MELGFFLFEFKTHGMIFFMQFIFFQSALKYLVFQKVRYERFDPVQNNVVLYSSELFKAEINYCIINRTAWHLVHSENPA